MDKKILEQEYNKPVVYLTKKYPLLKKTLDDEYKKYGDLFNFKDKLFFYLNETKIPYCKLCQQKYVKHLGKGLFREYCSVKCKANDPENERKKIETCQQKYGVNNISQIKDVKQKKVDTMKFKYGIEYPIQSDIFKRKQKQTSLEKYGVENPSHSEKIKQKISNSLKQAHIKNPNIINEKRKKTFQLKYGNNITNASQFVINKKESAIEVELRNKLEGEKIILNFMEFDIFLKSHNIIIEVDGENYHPQKLKDIHFYQLSHTLNDIRKEKNLSNYNYEFYRIATIPLKKILQQNLSVIGTLNEVIKHSYIPDRSFNFICDVISQETIVESYNKNNYKIFNRNISNLRLVLNRLKGIKYDNNESFLLAEYEIKFENHDIVVELNKNNHKDLKYHDFILSQEFCKKYINLFGKENMESYLDVILLKVREFMPYFIKPVATESISTIYQKIKNIKLDAVLNDNVFANTASISGTMYLKSIFFSYFQSKFKGSKNTPLEVFHNNEKLKNIIKYRIGINNSNEVYGLSMQTIIKGISAVRGTISFFKPVVAAKIYEKFLGQKEAPIVLDPCMGFGGRMLGFFMQYPKGTYIGCEPNSKTFNELTELKTRISDFFGFNIEAHLYNTSIEEFVQTNYKTYSNKVDLTFTSIPYYDLEEYSENVVGMNYENFKDWENKFIKCIFSLPNCLINMPIELHDKCEINVNEFFYLKNSVSRHLNKHEKNKMEYILKCF